MITQYISGTLPNVTFPLEEFLPRAGEMMLRSVQDNFMAGGRPDKWLPLKSGGPSNLVKNGALLNSISMQVGETWAEVSAGDLPYAWIQNFGGVIKHPGSSKPQAFQIGDKWVFTNFTKPHDIPIPARPYMMFQEVDVQEITDMAGRLWISFMNANGEPLTLGARAA